MNADRLVKWVVVESREMTGKKLDGRRTLVREMLAYTESLGSLSFAEIIIRTYVESGKLKCENDQVAGVAGTAGH